MQDRDCGASHDEFEAAREEVDRLRREQERLAAHCAAVMAERDAAMMQRDRAVSALFEAAEDHSKPDGRLSDYVVVPRWRPLDYPAIDVETTATEQDMIRMVSRTAASWSAMGEWEPYFTNVAHDGFTMEKIAHNEAEFFRTGLETVADIEAVARRQGIDLRSYRDCFELGCGVGRMTRALADVFDTVYGMDVSVGHLRVARTVLAGCRPRVMLCMFDGFASIDSLPRFDFFVSFAVLQHNPPPLAALLLDRCLATVRPGGAACFECQTYQRGYRFAVADYLQEERSSGTATCGWEMHCLPQPVVYETLRRNDFSLLEVRETGGQVGGISQIFFARRGIEPEGQVPVDGH